jgi:hypothetical protein
VRTQQSRPWKISEHQWTRTWTTEQSFRQAELDLEAVCDELNVGQHLRDLNKLHRMFHSYYEEGGEPNTDWDKLNKRIHKLEEQQRTLGLAAAQRTGFGIVLADSETGLVEQRPIPPELRSLWANSPKSGELLLGYYTLGKTIADCVRDNDVDCVRSGMVRAQQQISTETICLWAKTQPSITKRVISLRQVEQWVKDNALESYIDLSLAEHQYAGMPRLGQYVGSYTPDELNDYLAGAKIVSAELID